MRKNIKDLREGDKVEEFYAVQQREKKTGANGPFLNITLTDRTGSIGAVVWNDVERLFSVLEPNTVVKVSGCVTKFSEKLQIRISDARTPREGEDYGSLELYRSKSPYDTEAMWKELAAFRAGIKDPFITKLLKSFFDDPGFAAKFKSHTAAKLMHHACAGGLLEHTLGVARFCAKTAELYPKLDRDLLLAGAMLHDIGKLYEMDGVLTTDYTTEGRLLGHIVIGCEMVGRACDAIEGFPAETKLMIRHMIASHHGKLEFGSPVIPQTPEAMALFRADEFDSHIYAAFHTIGEEQDQPGDFTTRIKSLETGLYKTAAAKGDGTYSMAFPEGREKAPEPPAEKPEPPKGPAQTDLFVQ